MEKWMEELAPEVRDHPSLASFKTVGDLAKSWVGAQSLIGAEKLVLPKDEKDEAGWAQVFTKLGRPEAATGYQVPTIEGLPAGFVVEEARVKAFLETAHKHGLSQRQAAALYQGYVTEQAAAYTQYLAKAEAATAAAEKAMRAEWGTGYEAQVALVNKTLAWAVGPEDEKTLRAEFGNDPRFLRMLAKVGNAISEDVLGAGAPKPGDLTPDAAMKEINTIMADPKHAYFVAAHPEHKAAVERMTQLQELVHPGQMVEA